MYETDADRKREGDVLDLYGRFTNRVIFRTEPGTVYDAETGATFDQRAQIIEVKTRNIPVRMYADYIIDKAKIDVGLAAAKRTNSDFILIVRWNDETRYVNVTTLPACRVSRVRRRDRDDRADDVYMIPVKWFITIPKENE